MSAAQGEPRFPFPKPATAGPQLVRSREPAPTQAPVEAIPNADPHPLMAAFIIALIAATGAFTFAASILMWIWFRDTGVNWMFQG